MNFVPKSEKELKRNRLLPNGRYPFTVSESAEQASKSEKNNGRMMVALKLLIHTDNGDFSQRDFFADWFSEHKLRHFAEAVGKLADYEKGKLEFKDNAFQGATGYLKLGEGRSKSGDPQNEVKDYLTAEESNTEPQSTDAQADAPTDDDVPF